MCASGYIQTGGYPNGAMICGLTICPPESIFHYYYCCNGFLNGCCFYLRTWVIVLLVIITIALLLCGVAAIFVACSSGRAPRQRQAAERDVHYCPPREHTVYYTDHERDRSL